MPSASSDRQAAESGAQRARPAPDRPERVEAEPLVSATAAACAAIESLRERHGPLAFFQSGGCCDGSLPLCLPEGELPPGPHDVRLGTVAGAPFYVDEDQWSRWGRPRFVLDLGSGESEGFSLGPPAAHFVSRSPSGEACAR